MTRQSNYGSFHSHGIQSRGDIYFEKYSRRIYELWTPCSSGWEPWAVSQSMPQHSVYGRLFVALPCAFFISDGTSSLEVQRLNWSSPRSNVLTKKFLHTRTSFPSYLSNSSRGVLFLFWFFRNLFWNAPPSYSWPCFYHCTHECLLAHP